MDLKTRLKGMLSEQEFRDFVSSFDIVGSREKAVAIIQIPDTLIKKEKQIASAVMHQHKPVKSVLKRASARTGDLRLRKYVLITGDKNTEVIHREHGCSFRLDVRKVYFSPRESTERLRIASQVKPGEVVLVMFSGISPFPIIIAKKQPNVKKIYAIELNPAAHEYAIENVRLNKLYEKIIPLHGDVREVCQEFLHKKILFDRILMPLPLGSKRFLEVAIPLLKKNGIIHLYSWGSDPDPFANEEGYIKCVAKERGKKVKILQKRKVLPYGPRRWKVVFDLMFH